MKQLLIYLSLMLSVPAFASIVVEPIKDGDAKALVLVPGAKVKPEQYRELAKTIQQKFLQDFGF